MCVVFNLYPTVCWLLFCRPEAYAAQGTPSGLSNLAYINAANANLMTVRACLMVSLATTIANPAPDFFCSLGWLA